MGPTRIVALVLFAALALLCGCAGKAVRVVDLGDRQAGAVIDALMSTAQGDQWPKGRVWDRFLVVSNSREGLAGITFSSPADGAAVYVRARPGGRQVLVAGKAWGPGHVDAARVVDQLLGVLRAAAGEALRVEASSAEASEVDALSRAMDDVLRRCRSGEVPGDLREKGWRSVDRWAVLVSGR